MITLPEQSALNAAWDLVKDWTPDEHKYLRAAVPKQALTTPFRDKTVQHLAHEMLEVASSGLRRRNRLDAAGTDETGYLGALYEIVDSGCTAAAEKLNRFNSDWNGNIDPLFEDYAY